MSEWKHETVRALCSHVIDCRNKTAPVVNYPTPYKMLRTSNIRNGFVDISSVRYVTKQTYDIWTSRGELEDGDVIFTREAPLGEVGILRTADGYFLGQRLVLFRSNPQKCYNWFLNYALLSPWIKNKICGSGGGSIVTHLRVPDCEEIQIRIPADLSEQRRIADTLRAIDEKIELNQQINDNLEAMAQALYDYWFVQFDFPDANGKPYKSSGGKMVWNEVLKREIPAGWSCGQLGDIIQANPTEHLNKGAVAPYIAMEALSTTRFLTDEPEKKAYAGGMKFRNKDILIARITPCLENGKTALVHDLKDKEVGFGSTEYIVIRGKLFSLPTFCICLARSKEFRTYAISKMTGTSGRRRLDYKDVEAYKQPIPPASLLCKFENWGAGVLDKMHKTLVQNRILEKQRDFLLPLLMNGQVQVRPQGELNYHLADD